MASRKKSPQSKGGIARSKALSIEERKEIALTAAVARWEPDIPKATHKGEVKIGNLVIPCYVLKDSRRMLSLNGMLSALGMSFGGRSKWATGDHADRLASFVHGKSINAFISNDIVNRIDNPVRFLAGGGGGGIVRGYEATVLADLCDAVLSARQAGALQKQQQHIATQCEILVRGFARVGIISLVDEATGYQEIRDRQALQAILDLYLAKELAAWAKRFPEEFYKEIFRLRNWQWKEMNVKRPQCVAQYTNNIVYERLAPGILEELKERNPMNENRSRRRACHHQWLSPDVGHPALTQHIHAVTGLMRISDSWAQFLYFLDRAYPKRGNSLQLALPTAPKDVTPEVAET